MLALVTGLAAAGCGGSKRTIKIPESVVNSPKDRRPGGRERAAQPYVVKMSDGRRTWQIEIPVGEGSPSFQTAIPLDLGDVEKMPPVPPASEADREIIEAKRAAGEKTPEAGPGQVIDGPSYLAGTARVRELYKRRQYELALIELVKLERAYPDDERILEMKGTLYKKLNRRNEARQTWERVLGLNPDNQAVARALEQLLEEGE